MISCKQVCVCVCVHQTFWRSSPVLGLPWEFFLGSYNWFQMWSNTSWVNRSGFAVEKEERCSWSYPRKNRSAREYLPSVAACSLGLKQPLTEAAVKRSVTAEGHADMFPFGDRIDSRLKCSGTSVNTVVEIVTAFSASIVYDQCSACRCPVYQVALCRKMNTFSRIQPPPNGQNSSRLSWYKSV